LTYAVLPRKISEMTGGPMTWAIAYLGKNRRS
jgi:hypothetical protein